MGLNLSGYVLEPVRLGSSNSPYTFTPDVVIVDQGAFDLAYPSDESSPRTEYHVFVLTDGKLHEASFCWTKNEVLQRFGFDGRAQRFRTLYGSNLTIVGPLLADANTVRLKVAPPLSTDVATYPFRLSLGNDSGTPFLIVVVDDDVDFGTPTAGTVELAQSTGNLNWNASDVTSYVNQTVRFQQQQFFTAAQSTANIGSIDDVILLNPIPGSGQFPLIRIGFGEFLTPVEVANEAGFSVQPLVGSVEWAADTGRLKFNSGDVLANTTRSVYYEGSCFGFGLTLTSTPIGTVSSPGTVTVDEEQDLYFRIPGTVQFARTVYVDTLTSPLLAKLGQVEVRRSDGQVQFSFPDQILYGSQTVQAVTPDLPIERGISLRLFRTPIDLTNLDATLKDASAFYPVTDAIIANPLIGAPFFGVPATPVDTLPLTARITQGTGTFLVDPLPRLDTVSPPVGFGYILDYETQNLQLARRKEDVVQQGSAQAPFSSIQLPDVLLFEPNLVLELETTPNSNVFAPLTVDEEVIINRTAGLATLVATDGELVESGVGASYTGVTLTDSTQNFTTAGVLPGDLLFILGGAGAGVYTVATVGTITVTTTVSGVTATNVAYEIRRGSEVLADRYFREVPPLDPNTRIERLTSLGSATNSPRLNVDLFFTSRFRLGTTGTPADAVLVINDGAFTAPGSLSDGVVELSQATGNLNFSTDDLGKTVYWAKTQIIETDFRVNSTLGFIEFTDRMLENEEAFLTYVIINEDDEREIVEERATFLVRKELTQAIFAPTSILSFNPLGREVAANPQPQVFRGGRPQVNSQQVTVDATASTITFLPSDQVTDALPSGAVVGITERVYIDYFVYGAVGGEKSLTVLRPPFVGVTISIRDGEPTLSISGDRTSEFLADHLLRVDNSEVYLMSGSSYDSLEDVTTVSLETPQTFRSDQRNPALAVTSGVTRPISLPLDPSYFVTEVTNFDTVARGSTRMRLLGDVTRTYQPGIAVHWTDGGSIFEFNLVEGSTYDAELDRTTVVFATNGVRQYTPGSVTLKRSVRRILQNSIASANTSRSPELGLPYIVFRRTAGAVGQILTQPDGYTIDSAGVVSFTEDLVPNEELGILYTGVIFVEDGRDFRSSYSHVIVPNAENGMEGQTLRLDYTTYSPDSYYFRVETLTTFKAELMAKYGETALESIPTSGPRLENASQPQLFEQGRESLKYQERHLSNEDIVARALLKWYNDGINLVEDALQSMDGRIVGDHDGRFLFDGLLDNPLRATFSAVTNQIDDRMKIRQGPVQITMPGFAVNFLGTFQPVYKPSRYSRFFPTKRILYAAPASPSGLETGDPVADLGFGNLSKVNHIYRRQPWAVVTVAAPAGSNFLFVDTTDEEEHLLRPKWDTATYTYRVAIQAQDGTYIVNPIVPAQVMTSGPTLLTFTAPIASAVPVGATIYQVTYDAFAPALPPLPYYLKFYRAGVDIGVDLEEGELTQVQPFPPFDGTIAAIPVELNVTNPLAGEVIDVSVGISNPFSEPDLFSALKGGTEDDDCNRQFPILNPSSESENGASVGALPQELALIETGGAIRTVTEPPYIGTGSLSLGNTRITLDSGTFPSPFPKLHDLIRINSGANAGLQFRRVTGTDGLTFVEGSAWPTTDSAFSFTVTVSGPLVAGTGGDITPTTRLTDPTKDFIVSGVQAGHTVVVTSGANLGLRRQVTNVVSATELDVVAFSATQAGADYSVDFPLDTFGGTGSLLEDLEGHLDLELDVLGNNGAPVYNQRDALELFLDNFFTDVIVSSTGQTTAASPTLTDTTQDFVTDEVGPSHFIFVRSEPNAGAYQVLAVTSPTTLTTTTNFPDTTAITNYRLVDSGGLLLQSLISIQSMLGDIDQAILDTTAFKTLITTAVGVVGDASAFARATLTADLDVREAQVNDRILQVSDPGIGATILLNSVLALESRYYDKRGVWIDARINLETGILPKKERAETNRLKIEKIIPKQLTKLAESSTSSGGVTYDQQESSTRRNIC